MRCDSTGWALSQSDGVGQKSTAGCSDDRRSVEGRVVRSRREGGVDVWHGKLKGTSTSRSSRSNRNRKRGARNKSPPLVRGGVSVVSPGGRGKSKSNVKARVGFDYIHGTRLESMRG